MKKMTKIKFWFSVASIGFSLGLSLMMSILVIRSATSNWQIGLMFNQYGEGLIELILFPLATILGIIGTVVFARHIWREIAK